MAASLSLLLAARSEAKDLVILRDGSRRTGDLRSCVGDRCQLGTESIAESTIDWIGFQRRSGEPAPTAHEPQRDEVLLNDGSVHSGHLVGVSLGEVVLQEGSFDRAGVAWLHLAGGVPPASGGPIAGEEKPTPRPTPSPSATGPQPPVPPSPPAAASPPAAPPRPRRSPATIDLRCLELAQRVSQTKAWHGSFVAEFRYQTGSCPWESVYKVCRGTWTWTARGSLEFGPQPAREHAFEWEGDGTAHAEVDLQSTFGSPPIVYTATNQGSGTVRLRGSNLRPSLGLSGDCTYRVHFGALRASVEERLTRSDTGETETARSDSWLLIQATDVPLPERGLVLSGSRTIPVQGDTEHLAEFFTVIQGGDAYLFSQVWDPQHPPRGRILWSICPVGESCPLAAPPEPGKGDPCGDPAEQRALMDPLWNQRQMRARQLAVDWQKLAAANRDLNDHLEAWRAAIPLCAIEEIVQEALQDLVKGLAGEAGELTEALGKMATGDLSYMAQGEYGNILTLLQDDAKLLQAALGVGDPHAMEEQLADCSGLPADLREGAKAFVDAYAEVKSQLPEVQAEVNGIHQLDQQYWDQWHKYYQACLDYAACKKIPPTDCVAPPDQPAGPIPGQQTTPPTAPPQP
ncbi:MAG: hypothetical protein ACM3OB_02055 [Acidobacteriota bacterium]